MQTLQQALVDLVKDGLISLQDALAASARPEDLRIALTHAGRQQRLLARHPVRTPSTGTS